MNKVTPYWELPSKDGFIERQIIRLLGFTTAILQILYTIQLFITFTFTHYDSWIQQVTPNPALAYPIILAPAVFGGLLLAGKIKKNKRLVTIGLNSLWVFNLGMALLNGVAFNFQGTPMMLYLTVGVFAYILHGYYQKREESDLQRDKELPI